MKFLSLEEIRQADINRRRIIEMNKLREQLPEGRTFSQLGPLDPDKFVDWLLKLTGRIYLCEEVGRIVFQLMDDKLLIVIHYEQTYAEAQLVGDENHTDEMRAPIRIPLRVSIFGADADIDLSHSSKLREFGFWELPTLPSNILSISNAIWTRKNDKAPEPRELRDTITKIAKREKMDHALVFVERDNNGWITSFKTKLYPHK